ncbi:MAG: FHA domain-containing protein [Planctomycetota bacterium]|nr:MAG: FHA domain-containing protein [Planctomycetota bacterium]
MPSLFVIRGNDQGTRLELSAPVVSIGRDASNVLQLHDTQVSRRHAEIRRIDDRYQLVDLNSSNGTFVNGKRITEQWLVSGDQLQFGRTLVLFTRPTEESSEDLSAVVNIASPQDTGDRSQIISSIPQEEGSRIFSAELPHADTWTARARSNLQVMYRIAMAISHTLDIDQLLNRIMELIFEWVEADRGCIMLIDPDTDQLVPKVRRTRQGISADDKIIISKTILDYVRENNEGVLTSDAREDERWTEAASIVQAGIREAICVPMQGRYGVVGVIYIDTSMSPQEVLRRGSTKKFTTDHLKLMVAIGHQAALAVEDTHYYSAMVQAERLAAIGQTIAMLSHHIKNILQGIRGGSYLIQLGLDKHDEELIRKGWNIVEKNQNRISSLVLDMLTFSKEREPDLRPADWNETVADVIELMQSRAQENNVELSSALADDIPELVFDPEAVHRAVLNLVTNAIDAVAEQENRPGRVRVTTEYDASARRVYAIVEDNGPGIPPDLIDKLFNPFVSMKKGVRGTGLGLPVSQKIVREHGGEIRVESSPDQGTRFIIEIPAVLPSGDGPKATGSHTQASPGEK